MDIISKKALRLLQNIYSFDKINKKLLPLDEEYKPEEEYNYFKIKECLSRCGNTVMDISDRNLSEKILYSFFNSRKNLLEN